MGNLNNLKHKELYQWYQDYPYSIKATWVVFSQRVLRYWIPKERAIKREQCMTMRRIKTKYDDKWRICTHCWEYKLWSEFAKTRACKLWYTSDCKECRNKRKKEYRARPDTRDKELAYKKKVRTLEIWSYISFREPIEIDWMLREDINKVISYKFKKWYKIQSVHTWEIRTLDTNDNKRTNQNSKYFYIVDKPTEFVFREEEKDFINTLH